MTYKTLVIAACFCTPLGVHAAKSTYEENCEAFQGAVTQRTDLTKEEKDQWRASPNIWRGFTWENDAFAQGGDRHYTNGMKLSWLYNPCRGKLQFLEALWRRVYQEDTSKGGNSFYTGGAFGMNMYTPEDVRETSRNRLDRPYVGWIYGALQVQRQKPPEFGESEDPKGWGTGLDTLELQVGFVGPIAGQGAIQEWWHLDVGTSKKVPNWQFQVEDFLGVNAVYTKSRHYWLNKRWRTTLFGGGVLGNVQTFANAGVVLAFGNPGEGFIASSIIVPSAPVELARKPRRSENDTAALAVRPRPRGKEWSVFVGMDHRYIGHSVFIEGRGEAKHDIDLVRHVYDVFVGFSYQFWKSHAITYKHLRRSVEFRSDDPSVVTPHTLGQFAYELRF